MAQRKDYISAVLCLQSLPTRSDNATVPGARSRFDDFVVGHIKFTLSIHATVSGPFTMWQNGGYGSMQDVQIADRVLQGKFSLLAQVLHLVV